MIGRDRDEIARRADRGRTLFFLVCATNRWWRHTLGFSLGSSMICMFAPFILRRFVWLRYFLFSTTNLVTYACAHGLCALARQSG
eukprot:4418501-Pleurochrysis_carterae.AAC.7